MKIVNISESVSSLAGGLQTSVVDFASAIGDEGHSVNIIYGKDGGKLNEGLQELQTIGLQKHGVWKLQYLQGLTDVLDSIRPDLIIQHGLWRPYVGQITKYVKSRKVPLAIVAHGMLDPYILSQQPLQKKIAMKLFQAENLQSAKIIRALNQNEHDHIRAVVSNAEIVVAPNGLVFPEDMPVVQRDPLAICFLGRIDPKKALLPLIQAWNLCKARNSIPSSATLNVVGWGSNSEYIEVCNSEAKKGAGVKMCGPLFGDDKWRMLASCGAFILPSKGEGLPTAVLEAWAAGALPIISKECNFPLEYFGKCAIETSFDMASICASLEKYFNMSKVMKQSMVDCGRLELRVYDWAQTARTFLKQVAG